MSWFVHLWWWFQHVTGTDNVSGRPYGFWSGFGSDMQELIQLAIGLVLLRHLNCHAKGCKSIRTHPVPGTPFKACKKHNPAVPKQITAAHIADAYDAKKVV